MALSYHAFVDELLIACAVVVDRQTNVLIDIDLATGCIKRMFDESWPEAAMRQLADDGMLRGSYSLKHQAQYNLTGHGLMRAEQLAESRGLELMDLIDDYERRSIARGLEDNLFPPQPDTLVLTAREGAFQTIVKLGRMIRISDEGRRLKKGYDALWDDLHKNNALKAGHDAEVSEYLSRLDMGRNLLEAEHAYQDLLHCFLLTSLRWIYPKVEHEGLRFQIQRLIDSTASFLE